MSSSPQVAASLRAERLPLDQVPVVDFGLFLDGDPARGGDQRGPHRRRRPLRLRLPGPAGPGRPGRVRNAAGRWIDAKPVPGTFVINVGDMLARWTNDLFPPTLHRVINTSGLDRQLIPFFYDPNYDAPVEVIPTCLAEGEQPKYPPTTSIAHLQERFGATLPYLDESLVEDGQTLGDTQVE